MAARSEPSPPGVGQVLVRIHAATVNPTDLSVRTGEVRTRVRDITLPVIPGWDLSGQVVAIGDGVTRVRVGDRVVGLVPWRQTRGQVGAYATAAVCEEIWLAPLEESCPIDDVHAATLPLNALTAAQALELADLAPVSRVLVTGAGGGVGSFATQLAAADGHEVIALADTADPWVHELGAHEVMHRDTDPALVGPVDAVIDAVPLDGAVASAVRDGGCVVATRFPTAPPPGRGIDVHTVLVRVDPRQLDALASALCAGRLRTRVAATVPLRDAAQAHRMVEAGGLRGKVVLVPGDLQ